MLMYNKNIAIINLYKINVNKKQYNTLKTNQQVNKAVEELYKNQPMIDIQKNIYNTLQGFNQNKLPKENIYSILKQLYCQ